MLKSVAIECFPCDKSIMIIKDSKKTWLSGNEFRNGATAALVVGVGLRLWFYFLKDSFWRDESMLLLNVAQKSFWELTGPLSMAQGAPIPLLWFYHLLFLLGLGSELPMRAFSLVANILALFLFYRLARLCQISERGILFATWLLAVCPGVILFASQVKPYSLDLLIACGFLYLAAPWFINGVDGRRNSKLFWYAGLAPWFSFPALFIAGGIAGGFLLTAQRRRIRSAFILIAIIIISFGLEYFVVLRHCLSSKNYMIFMDFEKINIVNLIQFLSVPFYALRYFPIPLFSRLEFVIILSLIIMGIWGAGNKHGWGWVMVLILPPFIALMGSVLRQYPIYGRLYLFDAPGFFLLLGYAVGYLPTVAPWRRVFNYSFFLVVILCLMSYIVTFGRPMAGVREGLGFIHTNCEKDDVVISDTHALPTVAYYRLLGLYGSAGLNFIVEDFEKFSWGKRFPQEIRIEEVIPIIPRGRRIWCIAETEAYARSHSKIVYPYWKELSSYLNEDRKLITSYISNGVEVKGFSCGIKQ